MLKMSDDNPYSPPPSNVPRARPTRRHVGPIASGLIVIVIATFLSRGGLLIPAILGIGSWWVYTSSGRERRCRRMPESGHSSRRWKTRQPSDLMPRPPQNETRLSSHSMR